MSTPGVFTPDERYDREHASDFQSRYGAYLRQKTASFLDVDDQPTRDRLEFAAAAWRVAQSPMMSPPYVAAHPRVLGTSEFWDDDRRLAITVEVAADVPREIAAALRGGWMGWRQSGSRWHLPDDNSRPVAAAVLQFRVPMPAAGLPDPAYVAMAEPEVAVAKDAVQVICGRLNAALAGVFARFDRREVA